MLRALIVEDDALALEPLAALLESPELQVQTAGSFREARSAIEADPPDLLLLDLQLPDGDGMDLVEPASKAGSTVVLMTGHGTVDVAVDALRRGATDFLTKPIDFHRVRMMVRELHQRQHLQDQVRTLRTELRSLGRLGHLVGPSQPMQVLYGLIEKVAPTPASVLITGETGTGKEMVARTVHDLSPRAGNPFVAVNCGAISKDLIASELFGHEKGSFTGAVKARKGCFEQAHGGTLFLDEIGEMPTDLQVSLLRVLETGQITRLGSEDIVSVDVRVLAATLREPREAVQSKHLREDLMYRLSVFPIHVPPLRERLDDIPLLCEHFLKELAAADRAPQRFSDAALRKLRRHGWPGNVRELKNVVHRASILGGELIGEEAIPLDIQVPASNGENGLRVSVGMSIAEAEKVLILATLKAHDGDKAAASKVLGISLKTLYTRLRAYEGV